MNAPLEKLREGIAHRILTRQRTGADAESPAFGGFTRTGRVAIDLQQRFEGSGFLQPPLAKIRAALVRFRQGRSLSSGEWRLVFSALALNDQECSCILEDQLLFQRVQQEVEVQIEERSLSRRAWLALCYSYFAYDADEPEKQPSWLILRELVVTGCRLLMARLKHRKEWIQAIKDNWEIFTAEAGAKLGRCMFEGEVDDLTPLQRITQIPGSSWLWRRVIGEVGQRTLKLTDNQLAKGLERALFIAGKYGAYRDYLLATCLTRYQQSSFRDTSHALLKQSALDAWGSPQLRSGASKWRLFVPDEVCAMVMRWFAKEDLEHFFKLLQGERAVDQARLDYWMRFIGQISYTRIVMGNDAFTDRSSDFVEFRSKNRDRISQLVGGSSSNNAVMMQIGDYFFVEFSEKGNACYVFHAQQMPFDPERRQIIREKLRNQVAAVDRITHMHSWQETSDRKLQALGILPDDVVARTGRTARASSTTRSTPVPALTKPVPVISPPQEARPGQVLDPPSFVPAGRSARPGQQPSVPEAPANAPLPRNRTAHSTPKPRSLDDPAQAAVAAAREVLQGMRYTVDDRRQKGGALWIEIESDSKSVETQLGFLGFRRKEPGRYWWAKR